MDTNTASTKTIYPTAPKGYKVVRRMDGYTALVEVPALDRPTTFLTIATCATFWEALRACKAHKAEVEAGRIELTTPVPDTFRTLIDPDALCIILEEVAHAYGYGEEWCDPKNAALFATIEAEIA